jgi:hypothetical protein
MEKLVYLLREPAVTAGETLRTRTLAAAAALRDAGASRIAANVTDESVAAGKAVTIGRLDPPIRAMVSFWMQNSDDRAAAEAVLRDAAAVVAGYLVVESVPSINTTHLARPGERMPGVNMVTCINRLPTLSLEEFLRIWYQDHKQVAQETQSTFGYVRNTVVRPLTDGAPACDGIVEEMFPIEALTDPKVWYAAASDDELRANLQRMMDSVQRFLDLGPLESHPMSHYAL